MEIYHNIFRDNIMPLWWWNMAMWWTYKCIVQEWSKVLSAHWYDGELCVKRILWWTRRDCFSYLTVYHQPKNHNTQPHLIHDNFILRDQPQTREAAKPPDRDCTLLWALFLTPCLRFPAWLTCIPDWCVWSPGTLGVQSWCSCLLHSGSYSFPMHSMPSYPRLYPHTTPYTVTVQSYISPCTLTSDS